MAQRQRLRLLGMVTSTGAPVQLASTLTGQAPGYLDTIVLNTPYLMFANGVVLGGVGAVGTTSSFLEPSHLPPLAPGWSPPAISSGNAAFNPPIAPNQYLPVVVDPDSGYAEEIWLTAFVSATPTTSTWQGYRAMGSSAGTGAVHTVPVSSSVYQVVNGPTPWDVTTQYDFVPAGALYNQSAPVTQFTSGSPFTMGWTPVVGDVLVAYIFDNDAAYVTSIIQAGVNWSRGPFSSYANGAQYGMHLCYGQVVGPNPSTSITINLSTNNHQACFLAEFSGPAGVLQSASATSSTTTGGTNGPMNAVAASSQAGLVVGMAASRNVPTLLLEPYWNLLANNVSITGWGGTSSWSLGYLFSPGGRAYTATTSTPNDNAAVAIAWIG